MQLLFEHDSLFFGGFFLSLFFFLLSSATLDGIALLMLAKILGPEIETVV